MTSWFTTLTAMSLARIRPRRSTASQAARAGGAAQPEHRGERRHGGQQHPAHEDQVGVAPDPAVHRLAE